jgi:hypothetical protein
MKSNGMLCIAMLVAAICATHAQRSFVLQEDAFYKDGEIFQVCRDLAILQPHYALTVFGDPRVGC